MINDFRKRGLLVWHFVNFSESQPNPNNFFSTLRNLGFEVIENSFPDHHTYNKADFIGLEDLPIIMTEKDAIKCKNFIGNFWYLKIKAKLSEDFADKIYKEIIS